MIKNINSRFLSRLILSEEVAKALSRGDPVVALESTIVTHGMPFPDNLKMAQQVEKVIKDNGATPATIALLDGYIKVGLTPEDLTTLAKTGLQAQKTSRRDLAFTLSTRSTGGTTVAATMIAAEMAGISVFVTGGIGGVHRGTPLDVSADLSELGRTPIAVVCAGVKSILDIGATLEDLETRGVPVITYGPSRSFPAFYTRDSGFQSMANLETPRELAEMVVANCDLGLKSGVVIACPIPKDLEIENAAELEVLIQGAVQEAKDKKIIGKDVTPFLLSRMTALTNGKSLVANVGLVMNNAMIGAKIAREISQIRRARKHKSGKVVVFGASLVDISAKIASSASYIGTSSPGEISSRHGGVGRNIASVSNQVGGEVHFVTSLRACSVIKLELESSGVHVHAIEGKDGTYNSVFDCHGELIAAVADVAVEELPIDQIEGAGLVVVDGNVTVQTLGRIIKEAEKVGVNVLFEPTSLTKSMKIFSPSLVAMPMFITPDRSEAKAMAQECGGSDTKSPIIQGYEEESSWMACLLTKFQRVIIKCGEKGCLVGSIDGAFGAKVTSIKPTRKINVRNVSGAGDSLVGVVATGLARGGEIDHERLTILVRAGIRAAELTCEEDGISTKIDKSIYE